MKIILSIWSFRLIQHNLEKEDCAKSLREIERVSKKDKFIVVDAYKNDEKKRMFAWNLTGKTIMHVDEWKIFFKENGYTGDHFLVYPMNLTKNELIRYYSKLYKIRETELRIVKEYPNQEIRCPVHLSIVKKPQQLQLIFF